MLVVIGLAAGVVYARSRRDPRQTLEREGRRLAAALEHAALLAQWKNETLGVSAAGGGYRFWRRGTPTATLGGAVGRRRAAPRALPAPRHRRGARVRGPAVAADAILPLRRQRSQRTVSSSQLDAPEWPLLLAADPLNRVAIRPVAALSARAASRWSKCWSRWRSSRSRWPPGIRSVAQSAESATALKARTLALWVAQNRLAAAQLESPAPAAASATAAQAQAGTDIHLARDRRRARRIPRFARSRSRRRRATPGLHAGAPRRLPRAVCAEMMPHASGAGVHAARGADRARRSWPDRAARLSRARRAVRKRDAPAAEAARWRTLDLFFARLEGDLRAGDAACGALRRRTRAGVGRLGRRDGNAALAFSRAGPEFTLEPGSAGQRIGYRFRDGAIEVLYWAGYDRPRNVEPADYPLLAVSRSSASRYLDAGRPMARELAGHRRSRSAARADVATHARLRRDDRAMARTALIRRRTRGAAIVMAMLLAALAASSRRRCSWQQQRWAGEYEHRRDQVQAQALAMAGVQWARQILFDTMRAVARSTASRTAMVLPVAAHADRERLHRRLHRRRAEPDQPQQPVAGGRRATRHTGRAATPVRATRCCRRPCSAR